MAVHSSRWRQTGTGCWSSTATDCPVGAATRNTGGPPQCAACYGIMQINWRAHPTTWPMSRDSTAFNADYLGAYLRACFEGLIPYLTRNAPPGRPYRPDDEWGCVGMVFSGDWADSTALNTSAAVREYLDRRTWTRPDF